MKKKEPFIIRHAKGMGVVIVVLLVVCISGIMASNHVNETKQDLNKESVDLSTMEEETKEGIYSATKAENGRDELTLLWETQNIYEGELVWSSAEKFIDFYEKKDVLGLKGMLTDGVKFDYDAYFGEMEKVIKNPEVIIKGFYDFGTDKICSCIVADRIMIENEELVFDYENSFLLNFSIISDGSVMPYHSASNMETDPYCCYGRATEEGNMKRE